MENSRISFIDKVMRSDGTNQAQQPLNKCFSDSASWKTAVKRQYADYKRSRRDTNATECSGLSNSAIVPENTKS